MIVRPLFRNFYYYEEITVQGRERTTSSDNRENTILGRPDDIICVKLPH